MKVIKGWMGLTAEIECKLARKCWNDANLKMTKTGGVHEAEEFLKAQPGTALGIAAGIGFLVGWPELRIFNVCCKLKCFANSEPGISVPVKKYP